MNKNQYVLFVKSSESLSRIFFQIPQYNYVHSLKRNKMAELLEGKKEEESRKIVHTYPLIKVSFSVDSL